MAIDFTTVTWSFSFASRNDSLARKLFIDMEENLLDNSLKFYQDTEVALYDRGVLTGQ